MTTSTDLKTQSAKIFSQLSNYYFIVFGKSLEQGRTRVGELLQTRKLNKILEVGVGTGLTFRHYPDGTDLTGIDINAPMIEKAKERAKNFTTVKIHLDVVDATHLPYDDNSFDCVYAPSVLSVVHEPKAVFNEMIRVCKPGGLILAICYAKGTGKLDRISAKYLSRLSERFLGFHMRLEATFFDGYENLENLGKENVNFVGPWPLSTLFKLRKK